MKFINKYNTVVIAATAALAFTSCDDFLDKMPDDRAVVETQDKVTKLLVSAYPEANSIIIEEMASDNAMDNGSNYTIEDKMQEDAYLWKPISTESNDATKNLWDNCYQAVASANMALQAIEKMGNPASMSAQRGEALVCRAWAHFQLANVFCLAYNPETADKDLGLPYCDKPETEVSPSYTRGNMQQLYANINADLEEGLPLIDDKIFESAPKYHFNRKAAYAFAARFNLYYQKWDKVIEYASVVLGNTPKTMMRDWASIYSSPSNFEARCNMYINSSEPANLLIQTAYSSMAYWIGPWSLGLRYGHNNTNIARVETYRAAVGGIWGATANLYLANSCWGYDQKLSISKYYGFFNYTDKVNGVGYRMNAIVQLCADETALCRAEAYAMKQQYEKAVEDINLWLYGNTRNQAEVTVDNVVKKYGDMAYMGPVVASPSGSPKKPLNPLGFTLADDGKQESFIQCILHMRRCETIQEGHRWMDIKRWGIEIAHNREGLAPDVLLKDDPRRAFQLPADVIDAGLQANPRND